MRQNIRVDIIYYLCNTDFEMEFNMNGCCPMRMLTGRVDDRGALVKNLAKAVSRSRVIMCCGPLFGGDGLISLVAASIGRNTERVDCKEYGIATASDISVIEGSLPLVTQDGYFGGCIIESGPQTIILLSENRNIRKSLMNNLIHPYLEDISFVPDLAQRMKAQQEAHEEAEAEKESISMDIDDETAAAQAAAIVAAALGEKAAAAAASVIDIPDISSKSDDENTEQEEPEETAEAEDEGEEITPADTDYDAQPQEAEVIEDTEEASQTVEEAVEETVEEVTEPVDEFNEDNNADQPIKIELGIEATEAESDSEIIGMVLPEDDNLFDIDSKSDSDEPQQEAVAQEEESTETVFEQNNVEFVAEVQPVVDEMPPAEQFMQIEQPQVELYVEPGAVTRKKMDAYAREYVPSKSDEMFISGNDDDYDYDYDMGEKEPKKKHSLNKPIAILVVLLVIVLLILGYVLIYIPFSTDVDFDVYMKDLFGTARITPFL